MVSNLSVPKSVLTLLVLALMLSFKVEAASTFTEIDISKVAGNGDAIKAAAAKGCGTNLTPEELTRRQGLALTAINEFINPRILEAMKAKNEVLQKALNCQKIRTRVLEDTCVLQASVKKNLTCETKLSTRRVSFGLKVANRTCRDADEKLFVTVTGINEPKPVAASPQQPCGVPKPREVFTTKFTDVDITKTPGTGEAAKVAAERVCAANLSDGELNHRGRLGVSANCFLNRSLKAAKGNVTLENALKCQKVRNTIMMRTCFIQSTLKLNNAFASQVNTIKRQESIDLANQACANVNANLFAAVPERKQRGASPNASKAKPIVAAAAGAKASAAVYTSIPSVVFMALSFIISLDLVIEVVF